MKIYRIDSTRWRIGRYRLEIAFYWPFRKHREFSIGLYKERSEWDSDEVCWHYSLGAFAFWWHAPVKPDCDWPQDFRHGWEWTPRVWQRWDGSPDGDGEGNRLYFLWRDRLWDRLFGKTVCVHEGRHQKHKIKIPLPEGEYDAEAVFGYRIWCRPRWPFHKLRLYTDVNVEKGLPFEGKGENSWDCGEDATMAYGCDGHDLAKAIQTGIDITVRNRNRYGTPSRIQEQINKGKVAP